MEYEGVSAEELRSIMKAAAQAMVEKERAIARALDILARVRM